MKRINPFNFIDSPKTNLIKALDKADPFIDRLQKQQRRDRNYSPSNAQLTELDFDTKLQSDWDKTLNQLNEIQDESNNIFEEIENNYEEDEVLAIQQNLENFNTQFDDIKNQGLQPLDNSIPAQWRRQFEILDKGVNRAQGAYDGNRDYSPESNNILNDEEFYHKRVKDFASSGNAALDALQVMNNLKAFGKNAPNPLDKARFTELTAQLKDLYDKEVPKLDKGQPITYQSDNDDLSFQDRDTQDLDTLKTQIEYLKNKRPRDNRLIIDRQKYINLGQAVPQNIENEFNKLLLINKEIQELEIRYNDEKKKFEDYEVESNKYKRMKANNLSDSEKFKAVWDFYNKKLKDLNVRDYKDLGTIHPDYDFLQKVFFGKQQQKSAIELYNYLITTNKI